MTCKHCVGAESIFDQKEAQKHFKRYQNKGPRKTSKTLIKGIIKHMNGASSVLDIGAGIGAVHLESMKNGVKKAIQIPFELEHYEEAFELVKYWREQGAYVGMMLIEKLKQEKK